MKKVTLALIGVIACFTVEGATIKGHMNSESHGGVALEHDLLSIRNVDLGVGASWLELNEEVNRVFPLYSTLKINSTHRTYFILKAGRTLGDKNYMYYEAGLGFNIDNSIIEVTSQHYDSDNYLKLSYGIKF